MIRPLELSLDLSIKTSNGETSTENVWEMLYASYTGNIEKVKSLAAKDKDLLYCKYNYAPPIHFAVREGHVELVKYLLKNGAFEDSYQTYPFLDTLPAVAADRGLNEIKKLLDDYLADPNAFAFEKDFAAPINYNRSEEQLEFENAVDKNDLDLIRSILNAHPEFICDPTYFWSEGILMMPAKDAALPTLELLLDYGATVPLITKWGQHYYFKHDEIAAFLLQNGMSAHHHSWQHVTLLHDMAQKGFLYRAELLIDHGADINAIDNEYQSTPLGLACRWGQTAMVELLLSKGAHPSLAGAEWAKPLVWAIKKGHADIETLLQSA